MAGRHASPDSKAVPAARRAPSRRWLLASGAWFASTAFAATPQPGLWTIDAEQNGQPGRGMQIDVQNGALVLSFYGYRNDGSAQWYLSAGALGANGYSGPLDRYAGGIPFGGTARTAVSDGSAGTVTLSFSDSTHGLITLPGESPKAITKLAFGGSTRRFKAEVWADNWFSLSVGERQVAEDSVPVTTERSFNSETFEFDASYPFDLNFVVKDYKQDDSGLEYIGLPNQQMGDGGFIMQIRDVATGQLVAASGSALRCKVIHKAPLNPACERDPNPLATCQSRIEAEPAGWKSPSFDASAWEPATIYTEAQIGVKEGYFDIRWDPSARLVWTSDLDADNTLLCKLRVAAPPAVVEGAFPGNIVLGAPTANSIQANVYSALRPGSVSLMLGTSPGVYTRQTTITPLAAGQPLGIALEGLDANTRYYYRLNWQAADGVGSGATPEYSFQTARPPGNTFTFALQGDSHPERASQFDSALYQRTLRTAAADRPDFYLMLGDDFSVDTIAPSLINQARVVERYAIQRPYLGLIGHSAPIFLVNGNHEQAARYLLDGTADNIAVWAQNARNSHYAQPAPDGFYSGNNEQVPFIGRLRNYYAWTWGDALFVVIDPYWGSTICVDEPYGGGPKRPDLWEITHGEAQYQWLKQTLQTSQARYKFVFAHHVLGTGRGGVELARSYEWGGYDANGRTLGLPTRRPGWEASIHQLFVANRVTAFFQGHDHVWVRQQLDGVTYQTLSEPADPNYALYFAGDFLSGDKFPNTGYTRVTVAPERVRVDYVRTYLPADEGPGRISGETVFSYTIP